MNYKFQNIKILVTIVFLYQSCFFISVYSQNSDNKEKPKKIELVQANTLEFDNNINEDVRRFIGDVIFKHDGTLMYCDSAYLYSASNCLDAFGNVHIKISDTTNIYGKFLKYNGDVKKGEMHRDVRMVDGTTTIFTELLFYDRNTNIAYYPDSGRIVKDDNVLTSIKGHYYSNEKIFFFKDSVKMTSPDQIITTDTMKFNNNTEVAYFFGPTEVHGEESYMYCEKGWYDTKNNLAQVNQNAFIQNNEHIIIGDSLYYRDSTLFAQAFYNVVIIDTVHNTVATGEFAEFDKSGKFSLVTDSAVLILIDEKDSIFIHADTLLSTFDSTDAVEYCYAYRQAKIYRDDLQGITDSIVYVIKDSTIYCFGEPVLWSEENQMTANEISIELSNNNIEKMNFKQNSFIISAFDSTQYDQIKGDNMTAYFENNEIYEVLVIGDAKTIYYISEEDSSLIGINKAAAAKLKLHIKENAIEGITFLSQPEATLFPVKELTPKQKKLKGFIWLDAIRPKVLKDIFK